MVGQMRGRWFVPSRDRGEVGGAVGAGGEGEVVDNGWQSFCTVWLVGWVVGQFLLFWLGLGLWRRCWRRRGGLGIELWGWDGEVLLVGGGNVQVLGVGGAGTPEGVSCVEDEDEGQDDGDYEGGTRA